MIRQISLTNWKAFERLQLELPGGTSFIVARNGVGKTSLIQALHFGLFGERRLLASGTSVERAVRGGGSSAARVEIVVDLNDSHWVITRDVPGNLGARVPLPEASVTLNGEQASESAWTEELARAAGVGLTELRLLAAIGEGGTLSARDASGADDYNLIEHLSEVLGVSRLREAVKMLRKTSRETSASADNERLNLRDRPERASLGEQERLSAELEPLQARMQEIDEQLFQIRKRSELSEAWAAWSDREDAARAVALGAATRLGDALAQHREVLGELVGPYPDVADLSEAAPAATLVEGLTAMQRSARALLDELRLERDENLKVVGGIESQLASIDAALHLLSDATAVCPTCRQPLSKDAVERARSEHLIERQRLLANQDLARSIADRADDAMRDLTSATYVPLPSVPLPPDDALPERTRDRDELDAAELTRQLEDVRSQTYQISASLDVLRKNADQRASDDALSRRLVTQYRKADLATVTADAFEELADSICRDRLNPLAELLSKRWSEVWPGPPSLTLDVATGHVLGTIAKSQISLADLSGGERAVAIVLLRLLALQGASKSPVLLMDEPLEHLDPRNRRLLASLLVAATRDSNVPPRQILVTTYEESVIRRLASQVSGPGSHVVYVSGRHQ